MAWLYRQHHTLFRGEIHLAAEPNMDDAEVIAFPFGPVKFYNGAGYCAAAVGREAKLLS